MKEIEIKDEEGNVIRRSQKVMLPKKKMCIIHGYFGHDFRGNQR